jgi:C4-dicarboxylate-specific signal transduction histidine kinase
MIIVFFGILACLAVFLYSRDNFLKNEKESIQTLALAQAEMSEAVFDQSRKLLKTIATQDYIVDYFQNEPEIQNEFILQKLETYNLDNSYLAIYLLDTQGKTLLSTDESFVGNNYGFREYFQRALSKDSYLDAAIGVTSDELGYYFSQSVRNASDEVIGVAVAKLDPKIVEAAVHLYTRSNVKSTNIFLVDKFGVIIYADKPELVFKSLGKLDSETQHLLTETKRFAKQNIASLNYDKIQSEIPNLSQFNQVTSFQFYDTLDREEEILALAKIPNYPFFIFIEEKLDNVLSVSYKISWTLAIFVALAALFAILSISIFVRKFFSPLYTLQTAFSKVSKGDLTQRVAISSSDELEQLGDSFNNLVVQLKKNKDIIEAKTEEKTKNLAQLNKNTIDRELKMIALKKELNDLKNKK